MLGENMQDNVTNFFNTLANTKGTNAKMDLVRQSLSDKTIAKLLEMTFNPYVSFNVVKVPKTKKTELLSPQDAWNNFIRIATICAKREKTGNAAIELMQSVFARSSKEQERWMRKILKKNLAIGISVKSLNKIQPGFIPTFEVSLAQKFDMKRIKWDEVYVEPKLDGIRCLAIVENGEAKLFTRAGKLISNFDETVGKELAQLRDGCYDGEIMSVDFRELMRQVNRKEDKDISKVFFGVFDYINLKEWHAKKSSTPCAVRKRQIQDQILKKSLVGKFKYLKVVPFSTVKATEENFKMYHDQWVRQGEEGIMIKDMSAPYQFKRDWSVMKYKAFFDVDVEVKGMLEGTGKHEGKLGSFVIDYKGKEVRVGSGLNDELREQLWVDPERHIGRIIEVRYQEETPDGSLRFPTFVCFRNDKL
jgi:DNA ligase 1